MKYYIGLWKARNSIAYKPVFNCKIWKVNLLRGSNFKSQFFSLENHKKYFPHKIEEQGQMFATILYNVQGPSWLYFVCLWNDFHWQFEPTN